MCRIARLFAPINRSQCKIVYFISKSNIESAMHTDFAINQYPRTSKLLHAPVCVCKCVLPYCYYIIRNSLDNAVCSSNFELTSISTLKNVGFAF